MVPRILEFYIDFMKINLFWAILLPICLLFSACEQENQYKTTLPSKQKVSASIQEKQKIEITKRPKIKKVVKNNIKIVTSPKEMTKSHRSKPAIVLRATKDNFNKSGKVTLGVLLPLSGKAAPLGNDLLLAAQMALFDLADPNIRLVVRDTKGEPEASKLAAGEVINEGAQIILGPLYTSSVLAVAGVARPREVPVVAFSNNNEVAGNGIYVMGLSPEDQIRRVIDYSVKNNIKRFSALAPNDLYGRRMVKALYEGTLPGNYNVVSVDYYEDEIDKIVGIIKKLSLNRLYINSKFQKHSSRSGNKIKLSSPLNFQALILPMDAKEALRIAPLLAFYDVDTSKVKLLGTSLWADPVLRTEPSLNHAWYAAPANEARKFFRRKFNKLFGRNPARQATLGYDATAMSIAIARLTTKNSIPPTRIYSTTALTSERGFSGVDGIFRLRNSGLVERGLSVFEVREEELYEIDPAPMTFNSFGN